MDQSRLKFYENYTPKYFEKKNNFFLKSTNYTNSQLYLDNLTIFLIYKNNIVYNLKKKKYKSYKNIKVIKIFSKKPINVYNF